MADTDTAGVCGIFICFSFFMPNNTYSEKSRFVFTNFRIIMILGLKWSEGFMNDQEMNTASLENNTTPSSQPESTSLTMDEILEITSEIRFS